MFVAVRIRKWGALLMALAVALVGGNIWMCSQLLAVAPADAEGQPLLIIMYHGLLKDKSRQNEYIISPELFEQDLKYLRDNGYETVVMEQVIAYVKQKVPLPEKPVMLTFDDGYVNNYTYAYPLLKAYNSKIVLSPIGRWADVYSKSHDQNPNYAHCSWTVLKEMQRSGLVEIQNHSYDNHSLNAGRKGIKKKESETLAEYRTLLFDDILKMQRRVKEELGVVPTTFTYPFGAVSKESLPILKEMGFEATLGCQEKINYLTHDAECLYELGRFRRVNGVGSERYFSKILKE